MNFKLYLKDKLTAVCIFLVTWINMLIFSLAFRNRLEQVLIISGIYWISEILLLLWDFFRKQGFFLKLISQSEKLDQKYLLPELMERPDFYEGKIIYDILQETGKSMTEHVAIHRRLFSEFREYIELWVHEIKLPVASLQLMCHNLSDASLYVRQLARMDEYIENVLYYARSENAEKDYLIKETSLKKIFTGTALKHREELQQWNVSLQTRDLDKHVMTDSKWLEYILGQLMGNSMKYLSPDREPEILLYTEETKDFVTLHFRDNGIGIPASDLPYIFEKSFTGVNGRIHHANGSPASTGFGLYIVKNLCARLGHGITAESVPGEYTDMMITFGKNPFILKYS